MQVSITAQKFETYHRLRQWELLEIQDVEGPEPDNSHPVLIVDQHSRQILLFHHEILWF